MGLTTGAKPAVHAIKAQQPRRQHQHAALLQSLIHLQACRRCIFGVQALVEIKVRSQVLALIFQQGAHARRKVQAQRQRIPFPDAITAAFQRHAQHGFTAHHGIARIHHLA